MFLSMSCTCCAPAVQKLLLRYRKQAHLETVPLKGDNIPCVVERLASALFDSRTPILVYTSL
jgi:hypothetical protein